MRSAINGLVLRLARMPADPHVPEGSSASVLVFHPGKNYYTLRVIVWTIANIFACLPIALFYLASYIPTLPAPIQTFWRFCGTGALALFAISLPLTWALQRLNVDMRWYIVTDRSLRIRRGIVRVQEFTMTFANIQEIRVSVNPLQRILGLANVEVHSAGGGSSEAHGGSHGHTAHFDSVDNADVIRDLMMQRLRAYRDSGLDHHAAVQPAPDTGALAAARLVLDEARALRASLQVQS
ncbi:MAG: PH domain-containing protein [Acidobacteriota bacterium]